MIKTAMEWLRGGATTPRARRRERQMSSAPQSCVKSPCCSLMLVKLPRGLNEVDHYRCAECSTLYVWSGQEWVACEVPEQHRAFSREIVGSHDA